MCMVNLVLCDADNIECIIIFVKESENTWRSEYKISTMPEPWIWWKED